MSGRQHVWVGPETTSFEAACDACLARRHERGPVDHWDSWSVSVSAATVEGTLRREADVGFTTCRRGHRIIVRRVGRNLAQLTFN
jgi:hypothetical protein